LAKFYKYSKLNKNFLRQLIGDWGLGIGDWGLGCLGLGAEPQKPNHNNNTPTHPTKN